MFYYLVSGQSSFFLHTKNIRNSPETQKYSSQERRLYVELSLLDISKGIKSPWRNLTLFIIYLRGLQFKQTM